MAELADVLELIDAAVAHFGLSKEDLLAFQRKKRVDRGGFEQQIWLESVDEPTTE